MNTPEKTLSLTAAVESVAEDYLALLGAHGVDYLYMGAGTDTAPLVEAYARAQRPGHVSPRYPVPIVAVHENLAVGMAHGYTMVTGRPQAVMLHVSVGAANAVCGIMNAARAQIPMLFTAGRTPLYDHGHKGSRNSEIHWAQEMFDQAGMIRELVKWDYELRDGLQVRDIIERALTIAQTHPRGPVSLTLPREVLAQTPATPTALSGVPCPLPLPCGPAPDAQGVRKIAQAFTTAMCPVIVCTASGADPETVAPLVALCERFGIGVAEANGRVMNFPTDHPLYLGRSVAELTPHADALLFLESDVPWLPGRSEPPAATFVAHAGTDPLFARYPSRAFRSDVTLTTTVAALLPALDTALADAAPTISSRRDRVESLAAQLAAVRSRRWTQAVGTDDNAPINKSFLSQCINEFKPADAIVVNEYSLQRDGLDLVQPGAYFGMPPSAGLGWGMPAALGAQQAAPGRMVIGVFGDGAYLFANPAACHQAAEMHGLPVLTVVYNNECWGAVQSAALGVYPDSHTAAVTQAGRKAPLASIAPVPDFERYVEASRGYGERVTVRAQLRPALQRAAKAVRSGRQALLNVIGS